MEYLLNFIGRRVGQFVHPSKTYNAVCQYRTNLKLSFWKKYSPFAEKNVCYCFNKMKPNTHYFPRINCEGKSGNSVN